MAAPMTSRMDTPSHRAPEILRRKALAAAASVVLAFSSAGCATDKPESDGDIDLTETVGPASDLDSGGAGTTDSGDGATTTSEDTGAFSEDGASCVGLSPEETVACCSDLMAWCADAYPDDGDALNECVFGADFDGSTGCVPWGPPVPPQATLA